jgi:DNA-binding Xre family transcriptional regulator
MLFYNVKRVLELRGVEKPYSFLARKGFVSHTITNFLSNSVGYIKAEQMEKLCILFNCTPNEFYEWRPDKSTSLPEDHPLQALKRHIPSPHISNLVKDVPVEKMRELEAFINDLKNRA